MQIKSVKKSCQALLCALVSATCLPLSANEVTVHKNATTGLLTWQVEDEGFSIELIQLIPDFVRAIYSKHNFPQDEVERVASSYCVFGTILKNTSSQSMHYRVADWRYRTGGGKVRAVKTKTQWLEEWQKKGITFSWTLLPDSGDFAVGDWQQGFTTIELSDDMTRESVFDFIYTWKLGERSYSGTIKGLRCAPAQLDLK